MQAPMCRDWKKVGEAEFLGFKGDQDPLPVCWPCWPCKKLKDLYAEFFNLGNYSRM